MVRHHFRFLNAKVREWGFLRQYLSLKSSAVFAKWGFKHVVVRVLGTAAATGAVAADAHRSGDREDRPDSHGGFGGLGLGVDRADWHSSDPVLEWYSVDRAMMDRPPPGFEWLDSGVQKLWPHLDSGLQKFLNDDLLPAIRAAVGQFLGSEISLELRMGQLAPTVGPVAVRAVPAANNAEGEDRLELHIGADYRGDLTVVVDTPFQKLSLGELRIRGPCMVALHPLCDSVNPVGGLSITCPDQPYIDVQLNSPGSVLERVNLYPQIKSAVDGVISDLLVMPHSIAVGIPTVTGPRTDRTKVQYPEPDGLLRLKVESAEGLPQSNSWNPFKSATSDPYVVAKVGADTWETKSAGRVKRPEWTEDNENSFLVYNGARQNVMVEVFSKGLTVSHRLGRGGVPISSLIAAPGVKRKVELYDFETGKQRCGCVYVSGEWLQPSTLTPRLLPPTSPARHGGGTAEQLLSVRVDRITGVAAPARDTSLSGARVRVRCGSVVTATSPGYAGPSDARLSVGSCPAVASLLKQGVPAGKIASALGLPEAAVKEFPRKGASSGDSETDAREQREWYNATRRAQATASAAVEPHWDQILHVATPPAPSARLELLTGDGTVHAAATVPLAEGRREGPIELKTASGASLQLHGYVQMKELLKASCA